MAKTKCKPGPKPKNGERYPSGKLKPVSQETGLAPATTAYMIRALAEKVGHQAMESPLGWLRLHNILDDRQCDAGMTYARIREEYISRKGLPRPTAAPVGFEISHGRGESTPGSEKAATKAARRFNGAVTAAGGTLAVRNLLDHVCVFRIHPTAWELTDLIKALNLLHNHFALTGRGRE